MMCVELSYIFTLNLHRTRCVFCAAIFGPKWLMKWPLSVTSFEISKFHMQMSPIKCLYTVTHCGEVGLGCGRGSAAANFPVVSGRCYFQKQPMPFVIFIIIYGLKRTWTALNRVVGVVRVHSFFYKNVEFFRLRLNVLNDFRISTSNILKHVLLKYIYWF